jgi:hypothetical protein
MRGEIWRVLKKGSWGQWSEAGNPVDKGGGRGAEKWGERRAARNYD